MQSFTTERRAGISIAALALLVAGLAGGAAGRHPAVEWANRQVDRLSREAISLYRRTPADQRVTWGGLAASALLALGVAADRSIRVRRSRIIPGAYSSRFHARLIDGKLDRGKALDFCELNPSPASRVVLAAVRRWGRPSADMERGVALARQIEVDRLRKHVGTLRRIAALAPLIGLLGTLMAAQKGGVGAGETVAALASRSLPALTAGVALAILSLVAYDGLTARVEALSSALDRLGAEAVDAIAMLPQPTADPRPASRPAKFRRESANPPSSPHASRSEIPLEAD